MTIVKNVTETKKKKSAKAKLDFIVPIKSTTTTDGKAGEKKIQKNLQNKWKHKNNKCFFLESLLSESFPSLGVTVQLTSLGCPPSLC